MEWVCQPNWDVSEDLDLISDLGYYSYKNLTADIAIIGAGVAGCTAALRLAPNYRVVLIDHVENPMGRVGECLAPAARRILKKLDLLPILEPVRGVPSPHLCHQGTISFWGSEQGIISDSLRNPDGFGWHLDRATFERELRKEALNRGVLGLWPYRLMDSAFSDGKWWLHLQEKENKGNSCSCGTCLVIDATGRNAQFARKIGFQRQRIDKLTAQWAIMDDHGTLPLSTISSSEDGWWYSAPLPGGKRMMAFHSDTDLCKVPTNDSSFLNLVRTNKEMSELLEQCQGTLRFQGVTTAASGYLSQVAGKQWVALGDAATSFDPLSSQGMYNGMASAMQLAELVSSCGIIKDPTVENWVSFQSLYSKQVANIWRHYIGHRNHFYSQEQRWKKHQFWKRRHRSMFTS